jgi:glycosidase
MEPETTSGLRSMMKLARFPARNCILAVLALAFANHAFASPPLASGAVLSRHGEIFQAQSNVSHTFTYTSDKDLSSVNVAGTFNNWDKAATPLSHNGRVWSATVALAPGQIQYKFVLNGDTWIMDPANPKFFQEGDGNRNSLLVIMPADYNEPAVKGDGKIAASALYHDQTPKYLDYDRGRMLFSLRVRPDDIEKVDVVVNGKMHPLTRQSAGDFYEIDEATVPWDRKTDLTYVFRLQDGKTVEWYGANGVLAQGGAPFKVDAKSFKPLTVPDWPQHSVVYQIFPDRFADGDKSNDPPNVAPWGSKPEYFNFFGGDIAGVDQHMDYLKNLGVKLIYFNPVFASRSNHRYETQDYLKIDPRFGTNDEFADMVKRFHADGIKVMIDGVFNHTGTDFFAFKDIMEKGKESNYTNWYFIKSYPVVPRENPPYEAWYGFASLPKLHMANPETERYMLGVPKFWDDFAHLDGWRLDVPNEVVDAFWPKFRSVVKSGDNERWIVGEIWADGNHWLQGNMFDSIMGYQFRVQALALLADQTIGPATFYAKLMDIYTSYPPQVSRNLMNLLGSHDTERFLTLCHGDKNRAKLGAAIQLTWPGAPSIYYGDELGMEGGKDPDNRRCMDWASANDSNEMLRYYKLLIASRNASAALQTGDPLLIESSDSDGTLAYERIEGEDVGLTAVNVTKSSKTLALQFLPPVEMIDVLSGTHYRAGNAVNIDLGPESAAILLPVPEAEKAMRTAK